MACTGSSPTWTSTPDYASVSDCVTQAVNGDTINVSAGDETWATKLVYAKSLILKGAGCAADANGRAILPCGTTIRDNTANGGAAFIDVTAVVGRNEHRITGFHFANGGRTSHSGEAAISFTSANQQNTYVRVDHNVFDHVDDDGRHLGFNTTLGVVDHNSFLEYGQGSPFIFRASSWNGVGSFGDESWRDSVDWGSEEFMYIENNNIIVDTGIGMFACTDGFQGARYVLRFNKIERCNIGMHGTDSSDRFRSTRAVAFYDNTFDYTSASSPREYMVENRDASVMMFRNSGSGFGGSTKIAGIMKTYRGIMHGSLWGQADGYNPWDINDPENPYDPGSACPSDTCTATDVGALSVTVSGAGWTPDQWVGYSILKGNCAQSDAAPCASIINNNTDERIDFESTGGLGTNLSFSIGNTFTLNKVLHAIDTVGRGGGALLSGVSNASLTFSGPTITVTKTGHGLTSGDVGRTLGVYSTTAPYEGAFVIASVPDGNTFTYVAQATPGGNSTGSYTVAPASWNDQVNFPSIQFLNTHGGSNISWSEGFNCIGCEPNVTYFDYDPTATTSGTNQTTSVRSGTFANRPGTCTEGVYYFATDVGSWNGVGNDGILYKCGASSVWSTFMTPYTYPHPLNVAEAQPPGPGGFVSMFRRRKKRGG